ncbi:MAG: hypothetical protein ACE5EH_07075 [Gammaproteobacteria bacterium]
MQPWSLKLVKDLLSVKKIQNNAGNNIYEIVLNREYGSQKPETYSEAVGRYFEQFSEHTEDKISGSDVELYEAYYGRPLINLMLKDGSKEDLNALYEEWKRRELESHDKHQNKVYINYISFILYMLLLVVSIVIYVKRIRKIHDRTISRLPLFYVLLFQVILFVVSVLVNSSLMGVWMVGGAMVIVMLVWLLELLFFVLQKSRLFSAHH